MRKIARLASVVGAVLCLGVFASAAQADIRSSSTGPITATGVLTMNSGAVICTVSLTLQLADDVIEKVTTTDQGRVVSGSITNCSGLASSGTVYAPLTVRYQSNGGLPANVGDPLTTSIVVSSPDADFGLNTLLGECRYGGNLTDVVFHANASGQVTSVEFTNKSIPRIGGSILCPSSGAIAGTLAVQGTPPVVTRA